MTTEYYFEDVSQAGVQNPDYRAYVDAQGENNQLMINVFPNEDGDSFFKFEVINVLEAMLDDYRCPGEPLNEAKIILVNFVRQVEQRIFFRKNQLGKTFLALGR